MGYNTTFIYWRFRLVTSHQLWETGIMSTKVKISIQAWDSAPAKWVPVLSLSWFYLLPVRPKGAGWNESWVKAQLKRRNPSAGCRRAASFEWKMSGGARALSGDRQLRLTACHLSSFSFTEQWPPLTPLIHKHTNTHNTQASTKPSSLHTVHSKHTQAKPPSL